MVSRIDAEDALDEVKGCLRALEELGRLIAEDNDDMSSVATLMYNSANAGMKSLSAVTIFVEAQEHVHPS